METNVELKLVKSEWISGISKKTGKPYTALKITLQGSEKFTVGKVLFLREAELQMLGLEKLQVVV